MTSLFAQALKNALNPTEMAIVSQHITQNQYSIGFFYRENPAFEHDSGWRFLSGAETDAELNQSEHFIMTDLASILENYPEIQAIIHQNPHHLGAWIWQDESEQFEPMEDWEAPN